MEIKKLLDSPIKTKKNNLCETVRLQDLIHAQNQQLADMQELLEKSRQGYMDLYEFAPVGFITLDGNGLIKEINQTAATLLGKDATRLLGHPFLHFLRKGDFQTYMNHMRQCRQYKERVTTEVSIVLGPGEVLPIQLVSVPYRNLEGDATLFRTAVTDLTERRKAQELEKHAAIAQENARLYNEAQEAIALRDQFLSIASHELKTPLTPLKLKTQMMERLLSGPVWDESDRGKLQNMLRMFDQQVNRLIKLVDELLDTSRIQAGLLILETSEVDLSQLIQEAVNRQSEQFGSGRISVRVNSPEIITGQWDRSRLEQVLVNLLTNAFKFGGMGPIHIEILSQEKYAEISVRDFGIGMAPEDLPRIFERFERAQSPYNIGGLGLGLFISQQIIEAHKGTIEVESVLGEGSVFTVKLPRDINGPQENFMTKPFNF